MQGLIAGYWHKNGLELYRYEKGKPVRIAGGPLEKLTPVGGTLRKIVLIVGRDRLLHVRKRYPPAARDKLLQAVHLELGELFPFARPACYCRIFQSFGAYTELDIWAWDSEPYDRLKKILPFHYVIPEEAAFSSPTAEVVLWSGDGVTNLLAVAGSRFLSAVSHPADAITEGDVERFLNSLDPHGVEIHKMRIYGTLPFSLKPAATLVVHSEADRGYPPCVDNIPSMTLREFRVSGEMPFSLSPGLLFRVVIYCILGYALLLHLTMKNYEKHGQELQQMSRQMDKRILLADSGKGPQAIDYSAIQKELDEKLTSRPSPVSVLDMLARTLPKGSYLGTVFLNEKNLEVWISSTEPLSVLKALAEQKGIRSFQLKGPLNMEEKTGTYSFSVAIEVAG